MRTCSDGVRGGEGLGTLVPALQGLLQALRSPTAATRRRAQRRKAAAGPHRRPPRMASLAEVIMHLLYLLRHVYIPT